MNTNKRPDQIIDESLWENRYKPKTIEECILAKEIKEPLLNQLQIPVISNLLFFGAAGCGKTTAAEALVSELDLNHNIINASLHRGIDTIRNEVTNYAVSRGYGGSKYKVIILDEADQLTLEAQEGMRALIYDKSIVSNCRFILTCNHPERLTPELKSRLSIVDFSVKDPDKKNGIYKEFRIRCEEILKAENIKFEKETLRRLILDHFPDLRSSIKALQFNSINGVLVYVSNSYKTKIQELFNMLVAGEWKHALMWLDDNDNISDHHLFKELADIAHNTLAGDTYLGFILLAAEYEHKHASMINKRINLHAYLVSLINLGLKVK